MHPGDFIVTPAWTWHDHGKESDGVMIWLDGLDVPLVNHLGATFSDDYEGEGAFPQSRPPHDSLSRYGSGMLPLEPITAPPFAGVLLSLRAHPHGAGEHAQGQRLGRLPRPEAEIRQSGDRRLGDADHRHLRAAAAQGLQDRAVPLDRGDRGDGRRRQRQGHGRRPDLHFAARTTYLWCRTGPGGRWRRRTTSSCSATPTARRWRSSTCGASSAPTSRRTCDLPTERKRETKINGQREIQPQQAALQRRHDRARRSRQDVADGCDHQGAGGDRRGDLHRLRPDRQGAGGEGARHHHCDRARRVRDRASATTPTSTARATPTTSRT